MDWEKYVFYWEKWNFEPIVNLRGPEWKCWLFNVLPKQAWNENTSTVSLHSKQWFHEAEAKIKSILTFLVWSEMT